MPPYNKNKPIYCFTLFILLLVITVNAKALKFGDIDLSESIKLGDVELYLNGAGLRTKLFFDLYIAGLYLNKKNTNAKEIINQNEPMMIQIHVISDLITSENLIKGTSEGFSKATNNNTQTIQQQIDDFLDAFSEPIKLGDIFEIVYLPEKGLTVVKNRHIVKHQNISIEFKRALFGIWLSDKPAQESLKKKMLGL